MFPANVTHSKTLAILTLIQPVGGVLPISEMQSRWFALLMANKLKLPTREKMIKDINRRKREVEKRYYDYERHVIQVDWIPFMDELANIIGVKPNLWKYLFTDPKLWKALYFGPCVPYQYRLSGILEKF
jgi:dimethylaniline monooxygenase (N-oxide forming)